MHDWGSCFGVFMIVLNIVLPMSMRKPFAFTAPIRILDQIVKEPIIEQQIIITAVLISSFIRLIVFPIKIVNGLDRRKVMLAEILVSPKMGFSWRDRHFPH